MLWPQCNKTCFTPSPQGLVNIYIAGENTEKNMDIWIREPVVVVGIFFPETASACICIPEVQCGHIQKLAQIQHKQTWQGVHSSTHLNIYVNLLVFKA